VQQATASLTAGLISPAAPVRHYYWQQWLRHCDILSRI